MAALGLTPTLLLGGCGLIPAEKETNQAVVTSTKEQKQYELAQVVVEDVLLTREFTCVYSQLITESLAFQTSGRKVKQVYVEVGDMVKAGELLAALDAGDLQQQYDDYDYTIRKDTMLIEQAQETMDYELKQLKKDLDSGKLTKKKYDAKVDSTTSSYDLKIKNWEDEIYLSTIYAERLKKDLDGCYIYSPIDGTVLNIRSGLMDSRSSADRDVITVIDSSKCAFRTSNSGEKMFFPGDKVVLKGDGDAEYRATVLAPEEAPDELYVYMVMDEIDLSLNVGDKAKITFVLDERDQVMAVPKATVHRAGDKYYVYYENENGLRDIKYVEPGLVGDRTIEIKSGLTAGEYIIKR